LKRKSLLNHKNEASDDQSNYLYHYIQIWCFLLELPVFNLSRIFDLHIDAVVEKAQRDKWQKSIYCNLIKIGEDHKLGVLIQGSCCIAQKRLVRFGRSKKVLFVWRKSWNSLESHLITKQQYHWESYFWIYLHWFEPYNFDKAACGYQLHANHSSIKLDSILIYLSNSLWRGKWLSLINVNRVILNSVYYLWYPRERLVNKS